MLSYASIDVGRVGSANRIPMSPPIKSTVGACVHQSDDCGDPAWLGHAIGIDECQQFGIRCFRATVARRARARLRFMFQSNSRDRRAGDLRQLARPVVNDNDFERNILRPLQIKRTQASAQIVWFVKVRDDYALRAGEWTSASPAERSVDGRNTIDSAARNTRIAIRHLTRLASKPLYHFLRISPRWRCQGIQDHRLF